MKKTIAIITARGGSKRIPRKNIRDFCGKPIIAYSIEKAIESQIFSEVMVSTDDKEIADVAISYGAKVPFFRTSNNSDDHSTTAEVIDEVLLEYQRRGEVFDYACCIYPTAPFITAETLNTGYEKLEKDSDINSVFPIVRFSYPIQRALKQENGFLALFQPEHLLTRSQDLEPAFHDAGQFYWLRVQSFMKSKSLMGRGTSGIELSESMVQDIDNEEDWLVAEMKYKLLNIKEPETI